MIPACYSWPLCFPLPGISIYILFMCSELVWFYKLNLETQQCFNRKILTPLYWKSETAWNLKSGCANRDYSCHIVLQNSRNMKLSYEIETYIEDAIWQIKLVNNVVILVIWLFLRTYPDLQIKGCFTKFITSKLQLHSLFGGWNFK